MRQKTEILRLIRMVTDIPTSRILSEKMRRNIIEKLFLLEK